MPPVHYPGGAPGSGKTILHVNFLFLGGTKKFEAARPAFAKSPGRIAMATAKKNIPNAHAQLLLNWVGDGLLWVRSLSLAYYGGRYLCSSRPHT